MLVDLRRLATIRGTGLACSESPLGHLSEPIGVTSPKVSLRVYVAMRGLSPSGPCNL